MKKKSSRDKQYKKSSRFNKKSYKKSYKKKSYKKKSYKKKSYKKFAKVSKKHGGMTVDVSKHYTFIKPLDNDIYRAFMDINYLHRREYHSKYLGSISSTIAMLNNKQLIDDKINKLKDMIITSVIDLSSLILNITQFGMELKSGIVNRGEDIIRLTNLSNKLISLRKKFIIIYNDIYDDILLPDGKTQPKLIQTINRFKYNIKLIHDHYINVRELVHKLHEIGKYNYMKNIEQTKLTIIFLINEEFTIQNINDLQKMIRISTQQLKELRKEIDQKITHLKSKHTDDSEDLNMLRKLYNELVELNNNYAELYNIMFTQ
jgi:hypothetical protein